MTELQVAAVAGGALVVATVIFILVLRACLEIAAPNEIVVLFGAKTRVVYPGQRRVRTPLVEKAERMRLDLPRAEGRLANVYSKDTRVLAATYAAIVRIRATEPQVHRAIERFLGKSSDETVGTAKQYIEGTLRGLLGELTAAAVVSDREKLHQHATELIAHDLDAIGLDLAELTLTVRDTTPPR